MENKWYHSSNSSGNISLTVKGAIVAILPLVTLAMSTKGYVLDEESVLALVDSVFAVASTLMIMVGLVRKIYYKLIEE